MNTQTKKPHHYLSLAIILFLFGCDQERKAVPIVQTPSPNILFIIADDMGKDATAGFSEGRIKPNTPNLDHIKSGGLTFSNLWVNPTCSPTRASIITGKYGYRTGVKWAGDILDPSVQVLHQYIKEQSHNQYITALIGKWHLSGNGTFNMDPETFGIDHYAGLIGGGTSDYYNWTLTQGNSQTPSTTYITEEITNQAIDWINHQSQPWFLWLAYNAPHTPFHIPPSAMHSQGDLPPYRNRSDPTPYYMATIEAMDFHIGQLLTSLSDSDRENTIIIFLGDNGTPSQTAQSPFGMDRAKGSLYQGGINVPLFISGPGVTRSGFDESLINGTDLFTTIAQLAGSNTTELHDSKSFIHLLRTASQHRAFQYSEMENETHNLFAISNGIYKLIVDVQGSEEMYNLKTDPYETINLLEDGISSEEQIFKANLEEAYRGIRN
ncbi:MAG: sulfatase-like hydrolase/transferase [Saprospiraceae bacterium]|nr:sulfatase-like hydrolase/transferase [Saprospiraceae bacterium]